MTDEAKEAFENSWIGLWRFPFYMIPCRIIFTAKGHPVERHIPSGQVWEYLPPSPGMISSNIIFAMTNILNVVVVSCNVIGQPVGDLSQSFKGFDAYM